MLYNWNKKKKEYTHLHHLKTKILIWEKDLEKKLYHVNNFIDHIDNMKEMIEYFEDKNYKSKKKYRKFKTLTTIIK